MKVSFLFPVFLAATQFVTPAGADENTAATAAARDAEIIRRYDTNKDGQLDDAEIAAVKEQRLMMSQDKREEKRERVRERLKEFDKNGDDQLDAAEKQAMDATLRARVEKRPMIFKRLDTDGDGKLSDAEWLAGREKVIERLQK